MLCRYSYYLVSAAKIFRIPVAVKKSITILQLLQFAFVVAQVHVHATMPFVGMSSCSEYERIPGSNWWKERDKSCPPWYFIWPKNQNCQGSFSAVAQRVEFKLTRSLTQRSWLFSLDKVAASWDSQREVWFRYFHSIKASNWLQGPQRQITSSFSQEFLTAELLHLASAHLVSP